MTLRNADAAKEKLVVYSAAEKQHCRGLLDGFQERHPRIAVDFCDGISVALHKRFLAGLAQGEPRVDVFWSSAMDLQMGLVLDGHALPHRSPEAHALPQWALFRDRAYATTLEPLVTLVNRDGVDASAPAGSVGELARLLSGDPARFRARVACYDIERNGLGFLALMHEMTHAHDFDAFLEALAAVKPLVSGSAAALADAVASGRALLAYHVLGSYALRALRSSSSLAIAASEAPLLAVSRIAFICRDAPHPDAAKLFLDFLVSAQGQQRLFEAGLFPIRRTSEAPRADSGDPDPLAGASFAPIRIDGGLADLLQDERRSELLRRWKAAIAAPAVDTRNFRPAGDIP
jgi:iron(III) transport system substrate-binding protein